MYRKIAVAGGIAAVIIGSGTAALATTGSSTPGTPTPSTSAPHHRGAAVRYLARHTLHGQFVTRGKDGTFVTHDVARGTVGSVSSSEVTVRTADGKSLEYAVDSATKVRVRTDGKGAPGTISDVHVGDRVLVAGTGTGTPLAKHVIDVKK